MKIKEWLKKGMPLGVPFIIERRIPLREDEEQMEVFSLWGERILLEAIEFYREKCGAETVKFWKMTIDEDLFEFKSTKGIIYVSSPRDGYFRVGAKVSMLAKSEQLSFTGEIVYE